MELVISARLDSKLQNQFDPAKIVPQACVQGLCGVWEFLSPAQLKRPVSFLEVLVGGDALDQVCQRGVIQAACGANCQGKVILSCSQSIHRLLGRRLDRAIEPWNGTRLSGNFMKPVRSAIANFFLIATTLLAASLVFTYLVGLAAIESNRKVSAARDVLQHLEQINSTLRDAETAQRSYLLTADDASLGPYREALARVLKEEAKLREFAALSQLPGAAVDEVLRLTQEKITELEQSIQIRRDSALEPALALVRAEGGKATMERIRKAVSQLADAQKSRLEEDLREANLADRWRTGIFVLTIAFNLGFIAWAYRRVTREVQLREAAAQDAGRQKELLATTLASIGDGVIASDPQGQITFLNPEAERLTGWANREAVGQPLGAVLRVVDERTRQPVPDPVQAVLRLGSKLDSDSRIVLLTKEGKTLPIGESAAPIRQAEGTLAGVVVVFRDISELVAARETLARGKEELERLVEARTGKLREMITELQHISYAITHDMRAPLRAMSAFAQMLLDESAPPGSSTQSRDYCRRILTAAGRLDTLIRDALSFSRAVLQELPLQPVNLAILLRGIIDTYPDLRPDLADIEIEGNLPVVMGNESLLTQCFGNLLGNAVKFVAPGVKPRVRIRAEANGCAVRVCVEDNGIGIPKHAHPRLFGMFQKLDNKYEGTGIGLAIVRKVVERMGGKVGVDSAPGEGSRFWVELKPPQA
jgi:PAS domain S-box-containing protein